LTVFARVPIVASEDDNEMFLIMKGPSLSLVRDCEKEAAGNKTSSNTTLQKAL